MVQGVSCNAILDLSVKQRLDVSCKDIADTRGSCFGELSL
jgi:hypothetical protein